MARKNPFSNYGIHGAAWNHLVDAAVRGDWSPAQFLHALVRLPAFQRQFPGLIEHGDIATGLLGASNVPVSTQSLAQAISHYHTLEASYNDAAGLYGLSVGRDQMALLIKNQVSAQEFSTRLNAVDQVQKNPGLAAAYNAQLKLEGKAPIDEQGLYKLAAGAQPREFYDTYEAAQIAASGLAPDAATARTSAQQLGPVGMTQDFGKLVDQVKANLADIGPELQRRGVTNTDLLQLAGGSDPRNLAPMLNDLVNQRRGTGAFVRGFQPTAGSGGGVSLYNDEQAASAR